MSFFVPLTLVLFFVGSVLHFTHPNKDHNDGFKLLDIVSAINESVWEHMKIFIVAGCLTTFVYVIPVSGFMSDAMLTSAISVAVSVLVIPLLYYGYRTVVANNVLVFDIGIFFIACYVYEKLFLHFTPLHMPIPTISIVFFGILLWSFITLIVAYWTYNPPRIELFRCPVKDCFGHPPAPIEKVREIEKLKQETMK